MSPGDFYDEDDLVDQHDEYEDGDEELSPEDKAAMSKGTTEVQKALGKDASMVTVAQIQEALWHYYYDVDKSVAYLKRTIISPTPKSSTKKTPEGKSGDFSFSDRLGMFVRATGADQGRSAWSATQRIGHQAPQHPFRLGSSFRKSGQTSSSDIFGDMPWLKVPQDRLATLIPPLQPRGGLLGGGEAPVKVSKLQALAAARKKKTEEKKGRDKTSEAENGIKRLSLSDTANKNSMATSPSPAKRQKSSEKQALQPVLRGSISPDSPRGDLEKLGERKTDITTSKGNDMGEAVAKPASPLLSVYDDHMVMTVPKAVPSAFARTLLGSAPDGQQANRPEFFAMPHTTSPSFLATAFSGPSPDDIVLTAQAKAGKKAPAAPKAAKKTPAEDVKKQNELSNGVSGLKVTDVPPPKNKGLDVIQEFKSSQVKKSTSFVVVGHVDAGKSTLMGRLLLELKFVEQRTVDKYRRQAEKAGKQSFALAWVMDQGSEERDRGVTIDIATNHFETPTTKFTILDAPGHRDFVPNMIAGASQADVAILVIDANTGAFERGLKGQTREHVLLLRSLGVQRLIVAVNKLDMVDWSKERFDEISEQVSGFLTGLGFQSKYVSFVPISGLNGDNIAGKIESAAASWYTGTTLMEALEAPGPSSARALEKPFRMPISEVFRSQQGTTTLAGRIDSGTVQIGDSVVLQPSGESAYIKSIMVDTDAQDWAVAGQSVSIALTNIDPIHIRVGDIVCDARDPIKCGDSFTMKAMAFDHVMPMPVDLHRGRLHAAGQIQSISAILDKTTGAVTKKKPKVVQPGEVARMLIRLDGRVALEAGHRVVIRSGGETIAAGLLE